jgi:hypothetical protein
VRPGGGPRRRIGLLAGVGVLVALLAPEGAIAEPCGIDSVNATNPGNALFDSGGYEFDSFERSIPPIDEFNIRNYAAFGDGGANNAAGIPAGPRSNDDSWDQWGGLYIGATTDSAPLGNSYTAPDDQGCVREDGGRELVFPTQTVLGLQVQRKLFVAPNTPQGARLLVLVTNPGTSTANTSVQLGGTNANDGDLGSDGNTAVRSSSSGDATLTPGDLWGVTSDGGAIHDDFALAHVLDGQGGRDQVDRVKAAVPLDLADLVIRWQDVLILPGQTAAFMMFEVQQGVADANAAAEDAAAAAAAQAIEAAVPKAAKKSSGSRQSSSALYSGMTKKEIGSLRNWPTGFTCFGRAPTIVGADGIKDVLKGTKGADVIMSFSGKDKIRGRGGKDRICAGGGKDRISGGGGNDKIAGEAGKDRIAGGKGKDVEQQ